MTSLFVLNELSLADCLETQLLSKLLLVDLDDLVNGRACL